MRQCEPKIEQFQRNQDIQTVELECVKNKLIETSEMFHDRLEELDAKLDRKLEGFENSLLDICSLVGKLQEKLTVYNVGSASNSEGEKKTSPSKDNKKLQTKQEVICFINNGSY